VCFLFRHSPYKAQYALWNVDAGLATFSLFSCRFVLLLYREEVLLVDLYEKKILF